MNKIIGIIGLGYVGLPLAAKLSKFYHVIGYDKDFTRINELKNSIDRTSEVNLKGINKKKIIFTFEEKKIKDANIYIVTVPTPIDKFKNPDLTLLKNSCKLIGKYLKKNNIIIFESTVFPGCTEEICVPIIESVSKLKLNKDFFCGYSPERINPGDKKNTLENVVKVVSASNKKTLNVINSIYKKIIKAGTFLAPSIKVAEGAKVIENIQRDVNIALINELSILFRKMNISFKDTLKAANTKWNFLNFTPGLVGGHCIGVDPYYLTYKSKEFNFYPEMILAGRRVNDEMGNYIAGQFLKGLHNQNMNPQKINIMILGYTFKENCPDTRNTKVKDICNYFDNNKINYQIFDPYLRIDQYLNKKFISSKKLKKYDAIILAVPHKKFISNNFRFIKKIIKKKHFIFDVKAKLNQDFNSETL